MVLDKNRNLVWFEGVGRRAFEVIEKNQKLLSKATQDQWNKFILDNFEGPPADALKPDKVPVLV